MANHWSLILYSEIKDPNKIVLSSSQSVVLKDAFPKAKHHYLVIPKNLKIKNVFELSIHHLPLLDDMFQLAKKLIDSIKMEPKEFLFGFKLDPSMELLHLHVISTDFISKHLKIDHHWISFHTKIFLPYNAAYKQLKNKGKIEHLTEGELNKARSAPLKCNRCQFSTRILIDLKNHLFKHWKGKQRKTRSSRVGAVSRNHPTPVVQRTEVAAAQENVSLELRESSSNVNPQPSIKEKFETLNKVLETFSITTPEMKSTTNRTTITEAGLNEDFGCDLDALEKEKENVCQQQNATLESPQNISNCNVQPSLNERIAALDKILVEKGYAKVTETTITDQL